MTINASRKGDGTHGGILAVTMKGYDNDVTVKGCVFDGKLLGPDTSKCGGLVGYARGLLTIEDCLFLPSGLTVKSDGSETFARVDDADDLSIFCCFYCGRYFNTRQGAQTTSVSPGNNVALSTGGRTYDVSGLTVAGSAGAGFGGSIYARTDTKIIFDISYTGPAAECVNAGYAATSGTLSKTNNGYEFRSAGSSAVINVTKTEPKLDYRPDSGAYEVKSSADWDILSGYSANYDTSGLKFVQNDDITGVKSMIGTPDNNFKGAYDGGGHTLNVSITGGSEERCVAPFSYIESAVIKNLRVEGSVNGYMHCSGLVGSITGSNNSISNVIVNAEITTTGTHCGGVVGHGGSSSATLEGVVFTGIIIGGENVGAIWGWSDSGASATLVNCLENGKEYTGSNVNPVGLGHVPFKLENVYHVSSKIGNPARDWSAAGKKAYSVSSGNKSISVDFGKPSNEYTADGMKVYPTGVMYNGMLYAGEGETVSLSLKYTASADGTVYVFHPSSGTLTRDGDGYKLTMAGADADIEVYQLGDIDGDKTACTLRDAIVLARYIAGWKSVQIIPAASDVDSDGSVTPMDAMILARHIAGWKGYEKLPRQT